MAAALTLEDVNRLLAEPSADMRMELAEKVATNLSGQSLTRGEIALAQDIVRLLAKDVEAEVRASVAKALRDCPHLPHDVALRLANDVDGVALPLLTGSIVLTDEDLVEIVRNGSARKQETIAGRENLTEIVSDALVTHAAESAVVTLMGNHSARINERSFDHAITRFAGSERLHGAMVARPTLPTAVSERLVTLVSAELQKQLVRMHDLPPGIAATIIQQSREHAIIRLSMGATDAELARMIAQMHSSGRLTPTLMLRALCSGDVAFFEAAMAVKGDVPVANAQILIHEPSQRGLAALYRKAAMPDHLYETIRTAIEVVNETGFDGNPRDLERFRARVIGRVLTVTDAIDSADADYLVDKLGDILATAAQPERGAPPA
jgi:uncharacterized protein (DUF2336 family)